LGLGLPAELLHGELDDWEVRRHAHLKRFFQTITTIMIRVIIIMIMMIMIMIIIIMIMIIVMITTVHITTHPSMDTTPLKGAFQGTRQASCPPAHTQTHFVRSEGRKVGSGMRIEEMAILR
jgi:hypothetical protein